MPEQLWGRTTISGAARQLALRISMQNLLHKSFKVQAYLISASTSTCSGQCAHARTLIAIMGIEYWVLCAWWLGIAAGAMHVPLIRRELNWRQESLTTATCTSLSCSPCRLLINRLSASSARSSQLPLGWHSVSPVFGSTILHIWPTTSRSHNLICSRD